MTQWNWPIKESQPGLQLGVGNLVLKEVIWLPYGKRPLWALTGARVPGNRSMASAAPAVSASTPLLIDQPWGQPFWVTHLVKMRRLCQALLFLCKPWNWFFQLVKFLPLFLYRGLGCGWMWGPNILPGKTALPPWATQNPGSVAHETGCLTLKPRVTPRDSLLVTTRHHVTQPHWATAWGSHHQGLRESSPQNSLWSDDPPTGTIIRNSPLFGPWQTSWCCS